LIERLEPFPIGHRVLRVVIIKQRAHVFTRETARQQIGDIIAGERTKIETRTVEWIDKTGRVADRGPAIATNFFAPIRERRESVDVAFNRLRLAEDGAADRMRNQVMVQTLSQRCAGRQVENPAIVNDTSTDIAAAQRNDPAPPAVTHEMIGGPLPAGAARVRHFREFFAPLITVPFFHAVETRPHRINWMLEIRPKMAELARNHGGASTRVHNPAHADYSLLVLKIERDDLFAAFVQFQCRHFGGPHQLAAGLDRFLKQMRVERRAIDLKTSETRSVARAKLDTIVKRLFGMLRKPQAQSLFRQMMVSEVMSQSENPCHVTTADLGGRFAYFSIELGRLLDDQDTGIGRA